jgi:hypothetical protein
MPDFSEYGNYVENNPPVGPNDDDQDNDMTPVKDRRMNDTPTDRESVERHLDISHNHEAWLIPSASQIMLRALLTRAEAAEAERDRLRRAIMEADELAEHGMFEEAVQHALKAIDGGDNDRR